MDDDEQRARFSGLRVALAYAIKAASRSPAELAHHREALREIEGSLRPAHHPAIREELEALIAALTRLPVRDPAHDHDHDPTSPPVRSDVEPPKDLLP